MSDSKPIFAEADRKSVWNKIDRIARILTEFASDHDPFLMYGRAGVQLFLFYHCFERDDEENYEMISDRFFSQIDDLHKKTLLIDDPRTCNAGLAGGLSGIGWMLDHMIRYPMVEADLFDIMGRADPKIFRRMIYEVQEDRYGLLDGASGMALYCLRRSERFAREYLNRFIAELLCGPPYWRHLSAGSENTAEISGYGLRGRGRGRSRKSVERPDGLSGTYVRYAAGLEPAGSRRAVEPAAYPGNAGSGFGTVGTIREIASCSRSWVFGSRVVRRQFQSRASVRPNISFVRRVRIQGIVVLFFSSGSGSCELHGRKDGG